MVSNADSGSFSSRMAPVTAPMKVTGANRRRVLP